MAYSPYLPRTPQASRGNASAPSTPRLGQGLEYNHPSHRYASRLVHHDSNSESSFGFASPAHKSVQSYGTVQTDISNNTYVLQSKGKVVVELSTPSDESTRSIKTLCKPIAWIWVVINVTISGMTVFCLLQPYWLTNQNNKASLGILRYCEGLTAGSNDLQNCQYYQTDHTNNFALNTLPSLAWKVGMVMYIIACLLLIISSFLAGLCLCIRKTKTVDRLSLASGLKQLTAGVLLLTALVTFPVGFDDAKIQETCGAHSTLYRLDTCSIGWSYVLSTACSVLCFVLPILSHYILHSSAYDRTLL